eukprot:TRINITY_DN8639_c0_g1_i1.p2 TRINITY_DN8639_c0_g1~~TRINITY_DN8639_c0_g1_i1.p2  ORF type:complete len:110 (-),score=12.15 TRINITY_DN8639_c0_g1_i1:28-309(-)
MESVPAVPQTARAVPTQLVSSANPPFILMRIRLVNHVQQEVVNLEATEHHVEQHLTLLVWCALDRRTAQGTKLCVIILLLAYCGALIVMMVLS